VLGWLQRPEASGKLDLDKLAAFVGSLVEQYPALTAPHGGGRDPLGRMPLFIQLIRRTQPPDAHFLVVATALLRRLGNLDEALKLAREAHTLEPDVQTALAIAATHASRNEVDQALNAFQDALKLEPTDSSARVNMADLLVHHERIEEALAQYDEILEREPNQEDARPSVLFPRFVHGGGEDYRERSWRLADGARE
jgi:tetratricopeptide (TPR) repeat protein